MTIAHWTDVLAFWFGAADAADFGRERSCWFEKSAAFDALVRARFLSLHAAAAAGARAAWAARPLSGLALAIVLDQFPRNMFRHTAEAFATDALALAVARQMVASGFDTVLLPVQRWFVYLPFEHAEDMAAQRDAAALFEPLRDDATSAKAIDYAQRHYAVIERFGRFPHRNAALGRTSTPAERAFLAEPGSSF